MKQHLLVLAGGIIFSLTITNSAIAQQSDLTQNGKDSIIYAKNDKTHARLFDVAPAATMAGDKMVSKKTIKRFTGDFSAAENVQWFPMTDGVVAYFNINDIPTKAFYDKGGNHTYTTRTYTEKQLPKDVRAIVKRNYYDFSIYNVLQIDRDNLTVYMVYIKDENCFKTIRISDGEMDEYESHNYQH